MGSIDRVQFIHSIDTGNIDYTTAIVNYFDQLMGVFEKSDFWRDYRHTIRIINTGANVIVINIEFENNNTALDVFNYISDNVKTIAIYQRTFRISVRQVSANTVQLTIIE